MTQEEKARHYDEAIKKAKEYWDIDIDNTMNVYAKGTMEYLFPELKDSEDEKIRKLLIRKITQERGSLSNDEATKCIAWLEKQGG